MEKFEFDYFEAFSRNIGWITESEQQILRTKKVAIAGLGGVGGVHLLTLCRLGVSRFHIADFDSFDLPNFNRQAGATVSTLKQSKFEVMRRMALDINPQAEITGFPNGIDENNIEEFLDDVDIYVDSLDFFAFSFRELVFQKCYEKKIPATTAGPLGMGSAVLNFLPNKMSFEEYFGWKGQAEPEKALRFMLGVSPSGLQMGYLVDPTRVRFKERKGPSTGMACQICAGVAVTEALKILLRRGRVLAAPWGFQVDAYKNKLKITWRPWGYRNPIQFLKRTIARKILLSKQLPPLDLEPAKTPAEKIIALARWAPSGDNTQVWRFKLLNPLEFEVMGFDTQKSVVYDFRGHPSQIAIGALLESITLASSCLGLNAKIDHHDEYKTDVLRWKVTLSNDSQIHINPLAGYLLERAVQRRPMKLTKLSEEQKQQLISCVGHEFEIKFFENFSERFRIAKILSRNAEIRLTIPEAYSVHSTVIEWNAQFSIDRIPDQAIGADPLATRFMKFALQSWSRVKFLNRYCAGTLLPRLQLDFVPGIFCAAHFLIVAKKKPLNLKDHIAIGGALQRFWLTATKLGLQIQPEMTPLIFANYVEQGREFSSSQKAQKQATKVRRDMETLFGAQILSNTGFMGRIGFGPKIKSRSLRLPLSRIIEK